MTVTITAMSHRPLAVWRHSNSEMQNTSTARCIGQRVHFKRYSEALHQINVTVFGYA